MFRAFAIIPALLALIVTAPAHADDWTVCGDRSNPGSMLAACSMLINDPAVSRNDRAVAYLYRCQAKDMQGRTGDALEDCLASASINDRDASLYNSLTIIYLKLNDPAKALQAAERGVELEPDDGGYFNGRANARCAYGLYDGAYEDRLRALDLGRFSPASLKNALRRNGYFDGDAADGEFGADAKTALRRWTFAGCPVRRG